MTVRKALTFRASSIGDALNAKYLLENIHATYSDARCGIVVAGRSGMIRDLLRAYPWIEIIEASRRNVTGLRNLWKKFYGSDLIVTPSAKPGGKFSFPSKVAARLLAQPGGLIGFTDVSKWNRFCYDKLLPADFEIAPRLLEQKALRAANIPISVEAMTLQYLPQSSLMPRLGLQEKRYLVVHLFAGSNNRAISQEKRQSLIDALAKELPQVPFIVTGTKSEQSLIDALTLPPNAEVVTDLSVQELAALIDSASCIVSIGTGPAHMALQLGAPLVVLTVCFGVTWSGREQSGNGTSAHIFTVASECAGGHDFQQPFAKCIEAIDVQAVANAAASHFS